ncbi:hypothetical protein [Clostridium sp. Marseille-Q2269]|uniref:hypothetical protein n=1 Tax=Clostridium sp. Marseille-Q2269 TaxID=2942205 RepID=UPI002073E79A|nr:hypothetical protein [Clostridium sp. Marseille-Q2269]
MKGNIYHAIIIATVHYCFSIALGMWFAQLSKNFLGVILIVTFYIYCFAYSSLWTTNEFKRYISPTLQLCNINRINIINTVSLITLSIILLLSAKYLKVFYKKYRSLKIAIIICIGISVFVGIISFELSFNKKIEKSKFDTIVVNDKIVKFKGVDEHSVTVLASLLTNLEDQFEKIGIGSKSREYQFKKYYVSYLLYPLYKTRPVPIMKEKSIFYINIFSDAMVNFQETDLLRDFINRAFDQIESGINNIDNKYVYQIVEGSREHIYKSAIENNSYISSKDLVEVSEQFISKRNKSSTTEDNFLKKIINIMFDKYMDDIPKLYTLVQNKLPKNNKEFIEIIKEHFPKLLEDSDIKSIIESVVRSG